MNLLFNTHTQRSPVFSGFGFVFFVLSFPDSFTCRRFCATVMYADNLKITLSIIMMGGGSLQ